MNSNKEIEAGARLIAEDLQLPAGGSKKLARVVLNHLEWFDAAEARGMTWSDMMRLLSAAGALGKDGRRLTVGTLSSTVWRKRAEEESRKENTPQSARGTRSAKSGRATTRLRPEKALQNAVDLARRRKLLQRQTTPESARPFEEDGNRGAQAEKPVVCRNTVALGNPG
jgi:hypothetical protein